MKKIVSPVPGGGFPLTNEALAVISDNLYQAIGALCGSVAGAWVVSGCEVTTPAPGLVRVGAGYVFLGGELRAVGATTLPYPLYLIPANDTYELRTYGNAAQQNAYVTKGTAATTTLPVGIPFIAFNPDTEQRLIPLVTGVLSTRLNQEVADRAAADTALQNGITNEATSRANADTALQGALNTLTTLVNTKQNRVTTKIPWTDIQLDAAWTSTENTNDPNYPFYQRAQYMRTEDGIVHLRGYLRNSVQYSKANPYGGSLIGYIPLSCVPTYPTPHVRVANFNGYNSNGTLQITTNYIRANNPGGGSPGAISQDTQFFVYDPAGQNTTFVQNARSDRAIQLDGISWSVE